MKFGVQPLIGVKHTDYQVSDNRVVRVRLIHPNEGEQSMGADLIYEQHDPNTGKVRFIVIQYKIWNGKGLYWSKDENLASQLKKMSNNLCENKFCLSESGQLATGEFRFPYCTAFLRPTDKLQQVNSSFISSGLHIPICKINSVLEESTNGNKILRKTNMKETSISQKHFEDGFIHNQIGSRWLDSDEVEKLYQEHRILESDERIILHAQELEL
ncbi:MAG: hypothetical protein AAF551_13645 [Bacteroidota bacterium]